MDFRTNAEGQRLLEGSAECQYEKPTGASDVALKDSWRNLPQKRQLLLLALCRLSTPLSNACLLPYLYFLVKSILSDPDHPSAPQKISRLTGLLVAAYPLGQMSTSMMWARLSDKYGRKPTILLGLAISVIANLAFGFSRTIGTLLFWRILAGMANGILGIMRTMTAEIVRDRKHHTRAFLALPVVFNSGRVAALVIGGCLADPVNNIPKFFGVSGIFNLDRNPRGVAWALKYPYALPALFNGFILAVCLLVASLWLTETLHRKEKHREVGLTLGTIFLEFFKRKLLRREGTKYTLFQVEEGERPSIDLSVTRPTSVTTSAISPPIDATPECGPGKIWSRSVIKTLIAFSLLPLHNATFLHIFPVFLSMPISRNENITFLRFTGGLGLASPTVGLYLAAFGICGILLQLLIYPRVQRYIGNLGVLRLASCIFPIAYTTAPYLSLVSSQQHIKWAAMVAVLFLQVMARTMAIPSSVILLTEAAPRRSALSTIHGGGSTLGALASAVGPVIGGIVLALGIDIGVVGLVWWSWLLVIGLAAVVWSFLLNDEKDRHSSVEAQLE